MGVIRPVIYLSGVWKMCSGIVYGMAYIVFRSYPSIHVTYEKGKKW